MRLRDLELMTGFQGKESRGEIYNIISFGDVDREGLFDYLSLNSIECGHVSDKYRLKKGDIILKARGVDNTVAIIDKDYDNLLASAHFIMIRIPSYMKLDPYFLLSFLNSCDVKGFLRENLVGTKQKIIKIKTIEGIEIPDTSYENQLRIGNMMRVGIQEKIKNMELMSLRKKQFDSKLKSLLGNKEEREKKDSHIVSYYDLDTHEKAVRHKNINWEKQIIHSHFKSFLDEFYATLKFNTADNALNIFTLLNFMIIIRESKNDFIKIEQENKDVSLEILLEEVRKYLYLSGLKINLYDDILSYYNRSIDKGSLDQYISQFYENIVITENIINEFMDYICEKFYANKSSVTSTTDTMIELINKLFSKKEIKSIYDPAIGNGKLIYKIATSHNINSIEGQDISEIEVNFFKIILVLSNRYRDVENIYVGNTIVNPMNVYEKRLKKFDFILCNPPLSGEWGMEAIKENDIYDRFKRGLPQKKYPTYLFISHILESLNDNGMAVVLVPQGALFRGGKEEGIRKNIVKEGILDTVIYLPKNKVNGIAISFSIMIFNKSKKDKNVFFIDATEETQEKYNLVENEDDFMNFIADLYTGKVEYEGISRLVPYEELFENYFNLYNHSYIKSNMRVAEYDFEAVSNKIAMIQDELRDIKNELDEIIYG